MFWICINYTGERVHHIFRRVGLVYNAYWPNRIHAVGDTICGVSFSRDNDKNRSDMIGDLILGVDSDVRMQPLEACERCQAERVRLAHALARAVLGGRGGGN